MCYFCSRGDCAFRSVLVAGALCDSCSTCFYVAEISALSLRLLPDERVFRTLAPGA